MGVRRVRKERREGGDLCGGEEVRELDRFLQKQLNCAYTGKQCHGKRYIGCIACPGT